jgi:hypothetical protein
VALLVVLVLNTGAAALGLNFSRPGRSRAGDLELARRRGSTSRATRATDPDTLPMAVALGGTAVLAGTGLAGFHQARAASAHSSGDSGGSSDSSSDGGGGSGCGGCGGGGD